MSTKYTYKLVIGGITHDAYPALNGAKIVSRADGARRGKRREMDGSLVFYNDFGSGIYDYNHIMLAPTTERITVMIYRDGSLYWEGFFNSYDCDIDEDRQTIHVNPTVLDEYTTVMTKKDKDVNVLEFNIGWYTLMVRGLPANKTEIKTVVSPPSSIPATVTGEVLETINSTYPENSFKGILSQVVYWISGGVVTSVAKTYVMEVTITSSNISPGAEWISLGITTYQPAGSFFNVIGYKWGRPYLNLGLPQTYKRADYNHPDDGLVKTIFTLQSLTVSGVTKYLENARFLNDVLLEMALYLGLTGYQSSILQDYNSYIIDYQNNTYPSQVPNPLASLFLLQNTDAKRSIIGSWQVGNYSGNGHAKKGMMTFSWLMESLNNYLNLYWWVKDGVLRIEHEDYFISHPSYGIDLTQAPYDKYIKSKNKYSHITKEVSLEKWDLPSNNSPDFTGLPIEYNFIEGYDDAVVSRSTGFASNIDYIISNQEEVTNDGWVLLSCSPSPQQGTGAYEVLYEDSRLFNAPRPNAHLSIPNIQHHYWRHGRPYARGVMNGNEVNFLSVEKRKIQEGISFVPLTAFDPDKLVKTGLGWGEVEEATEDLKTEMITLTLRHD